MDRVGMMLIAWSAGRGGLLPRSPLACVCLRKVFVAEGGRRLCLLFPNATLFVSVV